MDAKTLINKSLFFLALCLFVGIFTAIFGQKNSLVGVFVVIIALMMLGRDLSVRPLSNLMSLMMFTLAMGFGAFISLMNPFLGIVVNFSFVFLTTFITMHDMKSPMHFPFLLGYAFMMSMPVTLEELPIRILALMVGSILTVGLNVLLNRNKMERTCHNAIVSMCDAIGKECDKVLSGSITTTDELDKVCSNVNSTVYDRLKDGFFINPKDRPVMDLVASLQSLGRSICLRERDPRIVKEVASLMDDLASYENDSMSLDEFCSRADGFLQRNHDADLAILASVKAIMLELTALENSEDMVDEDGEVPRAFKFRTIMKENLRTDSVRFTFAVRMAVLFTVWAFIWQYWELENAKWLLFTTVAIVQPYVEGSWTKSSMRIVGTLVGACIFIALVSLFGGTAESLAIVTLMISYIYTVVDPKRYDLMMIFVTLMALLAASMADPSEPVVLERVLYILAGVVLATLANHVLLPYHIRDENLKLSARYLEISSRQLDNLAKAAKGDMDCTEDRFLRLTANNISAKIQVNVGRDSDPQVEKLLAAQNAFMAGCVMLSNSMMDVDQECKDRFAEIVSTHDGREIDMESMLHNMDDKESDLLMMGQDAVRAYRENRSLYVDAVVRF